jgi:hypothetical protein
MNNKRKAQKGHAKARAVQRFGVWISDKQYQEICNWINSSDKRCIFLEKQSLRVSLYAVQLEDKWLPVVYDKHRKSIASVLPKEALLSYQKKIEEEMKK